ncbi:MAG: flagellar motor switch protein FliG [Sneathiella sp.]|jgi:flagellar motor switch protein FliG|uniref:flagellar motor switch protein FliG n=1 Tax=Sneathiella sp. TaxID=1964365 RepID=UPI000C48CB9A|nr:flagellar motor switch protein FliG [Sneathiella sp.]MAL77627.1 flagellar motor switch protein FliG [Sneathiella sp.]|tara:strand:- start:1299 stop:2312 length:1014 start_codon:yes stop_codon:yes gene_type:complete
MVINDAKYLNGVDKAAVMMLALGEEHTKDLWTRLDEEEIKEISQAMSNLGSISASVMETLFVEFASKISSTGNIVGSYEATERLLMKALSTDRVEGIMEEIRGPAGRTMWDKLANVNEQVLANYLKNEYPQTVAVVMSKISPGHAAKVLSTLPEDFALEVVNRMLQMESVQKEVLDKIEDTLRSEFMNNLAKTNKRDSHEMMAEIFNNFDRNTEGRFVSALEERNRDSAEKIKALMFTFEDLLKLDPAGVQTLLRNVDKERLGICLKGASESLRDLFFTNMSERAAKILREDMEAMGPVRLRDVDEAQMEIVNIAKDLADNGDIILADSGGDDELIY